jgi:hypothetical protein
LDLAGCAVFEFGSGNSTLWWGARAQHVTAVEHDPLWFSEVRSHVGASVDYRLCTDVGQFATAINHGPRPDIVVIDGKWRHECARTTVERLDGSGLVVLDNADWYECSAGLLSAAGYREIPFTGFGPVNPYVWTTSVFVGDLAGIPPAKRPRSAPVGAVPFDERTREQMT